MRRPALLAAALLLSSCSFLTEPAPPSLPLEYQPRQPEEVPAFSAEGGAGVIVVRDRYTAGVCHERETRTATRNGSVMTLRIDYPRAVPSGQACIALGRTGAYEATIGGLDAGTYRVRVEYEGDISSDSDPALLSATITVQ